MNRRKRVKERREQGVRREEGREGENVRGRRIKTG